jgi:hypothetical protein
MILVTAPLTAASELDYSFAPLARPASLSIPIFYDATLAAQGFPSPLVHARINGQDALFIVDTGASVNTLADWLAEAAGIASSESSSTARGSGGDENAIRVARRIAGHWGEGLAFELPEAIAVAFPPIFKSLRLGGLLSPQLLAPVGTAAVLDLKMPTLRFIAFTQAAAELSGEATGGLMFL